MKWFTRSQPLWLPPNSIRSIIALAFVAAAILGMFFLGAGIPEWFAMLLGIIIRDYFAQGQTRDAANTAERSE